MALSRRDMLMLLGGGAASGILAACTPPAASQTDCPAPTTVPPTEPPTTTSTTVPPTSTTPTTVPPTTVPPTTIPPPTTTAPSGMVLWSTQGYSGDVTIDRAVFLDVDAEVASLEITPAGRLVFDPAVSHDLLSRGNVIVRGKFEMHAPDPAITQRVVFVGIDEARFVGGGMDPVASDVGLWVMDGGQLDLEGHERLGWARVTAAVAQGATSFTLDADPTGWRVGDELAIAPMRFDTLDGWDYAKVTAISGRTVILSSACTVPHPLSPALNAAGRRIGAEVFNLTRNVRVVGLEGQRAHVFVRSTRPQTIRHALLRYLGPQQSRDVVLGRYALHIHMCGDGSVGSDVTGVVVRDAGAHAFVAHLSNGVTFTDCVTHNTRSSPYWWDDHTASDDIAYLHCAATLAQGVNSEGHGLTGFKHGSGARLTAHDCVAVGIYGPDAAGFFWDAGESGLWDFKRCVAHTNNDFGLRVWQNNGQQHIVEDFVCFHHWGPGIAHGAYGNGYQYLGGAVVENSGNGGISAQIVIQAVSASDQPNQWHQTWKGLFVDAAGLTDTAIAVPDGAQVAKSNDPEIAGCTFRRARRQALRLYHHGDPRYPAQVVAVVGCTSDTTLTRVDGDCNPGSRFVVS